MELKKAFTNTGIIFLILLLGNQLQGQDTAVYFSGQTTTWQAPACVTEVVVECWGAGGAGGSATSDFFSASGGGGGAGGAYARKTITVVPGTTYSLSAAGSQATSATAGGDSWFMNTSTIIAKGGAGGANAAAGANGNGGAGTATGTVGATGFVYAGGSGANGNNSGAGGAGGGAANAGGAGGNAAGGTGGTAGLIGVGLPIGGAGANGVSASVGGAGNNYGGGGSGGNAAAGGAATNNGGAGGAGLVVLSYGNNPTKVNSAALCSGQSVTLTASGVSTYTWTPNGETTASITVSPTSTTTYTVTGANGSCSGKAVATVTVYSPVTANSVTICPGNDATLFAEGCQSYQWSNGATASSINLTNITSTASYTVTGTSCGISSTAVSTVQVDNCVSVAFNTVGAATWTAPACVTSVIAEVWGGGGGGGGGTDNDRSGAGGGGGGYSKSGPIPVVGGTTYNMMVGAAGTAGSAAKGGDGGSSWFLNNTTILAYGGIGGGSGGNAVSGLGGNTGVGGVIMFKGGSGGKDYSQSTNGSGGGGGGSAGPGGNGKTGENAANGVTNAKGGGMVSGGGAGGDGCGQGGALLPDCAGLPGTDPGGGGGGGNDDSNGGKGGAGGKGKIVITYKIIPLSISVNNAYICTGSSATLTASGATTYTWAPATGLSATNVASVTANPPSTTTYTVTGTTAGCTATATSVVTFTACCTQATIGLSSAVGTDGQTLCSNAELVPITYSVGGGGSNATVTGLPTGVSGVFASGTVTINGTPTQTGTFNYTVTTSGGCGPEVASGSITINALPVITSSSTSICAGESTTLTVSGLAAGGPYTWQPGGSTDDSFTTPLLNSSTSYTVTGTDINGCIATSVSNVTVTPSLNITVGGNSGVCPGASNTLTASGATNYTWSPATFLNITTGSTVTSTPSATTTYTVVGDANGCTGTTTVAVTVMPPDDATFSYQGAAFCAPANAMATKNTAGTGTFSMTPTDPNMTLNTSSGNISIAAGATVQPYVVTLMTADACPNSYSLTINVVANPDATFSYPLPNYCKNGTPNPTITQPAGSTPGNFSATPAGMVFVSSGTPGQTPGQIDLTASAPGTYTVTNDIPAGGGCPPTSATTTVIIDPVPSVTVSSTTVCAGTAGTITAAGADTYTWPGGFPAEASLTDTPGATTPYTVTGTANGCSSTAVGTININANPVVGVIPPPAAVCPGQSATMTATGADSYTWIGASGAFPSTPALTDSPVSTATYTVTGTIGICTGTSTGVITVGSAPAITTADATICSGSTGATLTANGGTTYTWSHSMGNTSSINVNPINTTTYTVTGTGPTAGCDGVAYATVVVNTTPSPSVAAVPATICAGQSSTLTASPAGAASYTWSSGGSGSPLTVTPASTTPYTVTVTSTENCSATASGTVVVNPIPTVTVNSPTICGGETATLTAAGASTYAWSPNIGATASVSTTPGADASYIVTGTAAGCSNTAVSNVTVNPLPVITVNDASICAGTTTTLTANGANTYSWLPGGAVGNSININPSITTLYTVIGTSLANCTGSAVGTVTAYPAPAAAFADPTRIKLSEANILFRDNSSNANSWSWDFGDTATSILQHPQHQYADTGTYTICLKVISNGCADSICHDINIVPDVLIYIPNAFSPDEDGKNDEFGFKGSGISSDIEFRIFDRWGEQLFFTTDIDEMWKGDNKGVPCPQDVYVYSILMKDSDGRDKKIIGSVTLVR